MDDAPGGRLPLLSAAAAVTVRPWLWATALRQARRLVAPGWWRHPPFLPRPDPAYLRFRLEAQYGHGGFADRARTRRRSLRRRPVEPDGADGPPRERVGKDLVSYLEWCRAEHATQPGRSGSRR